MKKENEERQIVGRNPPVFQVPAIQAHSEVDLVPSFTATAAFLSNTKAAQKHSLSTQKTSPTENERETTQQQQFASRAYRTDDTKRVFFAT